MVAGLGGLAVFGGLAALLISMTRNRLRRVRTDLDAGEVCAASGPVKLDIQASGETDVKCTLKVSDLTFDISKQVMLALRDGEPYRVYYLPNTKRILSAELVEPQEEKPKRQ